MRTTRTFTKRRGLRAPASPNTVFRRLRGQRINTAPKRRTLRALPAAPASGLSRPYLSSVRPALRSGPAGRDTPPMLPGTRAGALQSRGGGFSGYFGINPMGRGPAGGQQNATTTQQLRFRPTGSPAARRAARGRAGGQQNATTTRQLRRSSSYRSRPKPLRSKRGFAGG